MSNKQNDIIMEDKRESGFCCDRNGLCEKDNCRCNQKTSWTRAEYHAGECTHSQYYAQYVNEHIKKAIKRYIGIESLKSSTDVHFNDIPLHIWDSVGFFADGSEMSDRGDTYSKAVAVCIAKEAARQLLKEKKEIDEVTKI